MYVVAARSDKAGLPVLKPGPGWHMEPHYQPVGVQHAVAGLVSASAQEVALCGADISGWMIIRSAFDPGCAASCQRCGQLVAAALGRSAPD
jgi:hypothetical protein